MKVPNVFRRGFLTSEFFVTILVLVLPIADRLFDRVDRMLGGPETYVGGLLAAAYVFSRGYLKARAAGRVGQTTDSGNQVAPGLGSPEAEAQFRAAHTPLP